MSGRGKCRTSRRLVGRVVDDVSEGKEEQQGDKVRPCVRGRWAAVIFFLISACVRPWKIPLAVLLA